MSPLHISSVRARTPWEGTGGKPEVPPKGEAPRKTVAYDCERGHPHEVVYAAEASPPFAVWCKCGGMARLPGAPEDAVPEGSEPRRHRNPETEPMAQLRKRRTRKQGEAILAEALERARQTGVAR